MLTAISNAEGVCKFIMTRHLLYCSKTSLVWRQIGSLSDYRVTLGILSMVTVPHNMVGLERMSDYSDFGLQRFHCS